LSATAHVLAWVAFLFIAFWFIAFWPSSYSGTSTTPVGPDGSGGEVVDRTGSVVEVNGWRVLLPLLVPVGLSAAGLLKALSPGNGTVASKFLMWTFAVLLIGFCVAALASIGMFYLPAALAFLASAITLSLKYGPTARRSPSS
jgi:hypothetical protein